jgi:hypothetical protein
MGRNRQSSNTPYARKPLHARGMDSAATKPHIGFLLAHHDVAVNLMHKIVPEQVATLMARYNKMMQELQESMANTP